MATLSQKSVMFAGEDFFSFFSANFSEVPQLIKTDFLTLLSSEELQKTHRLHSLHLKCLPTFKIVHMDSAKLKCITKKGYSH